jgi:hypothetical protein
MQTYHQSIVKFAKSIFMIWIPNIIKKAKSVLSSVSQALPVVRSYFISCYRMVRSIIGCLSLRFSKNVFLDPKCRICQLTSYSCGTVLVIILLLLNFNFLRGQRGKFFGKNKQDYILETYLFTVDWGHPDTNILDVDHSEIPQEHKCAHILELNNGNYASQPNNRILWNIPSYTTKFNKPDYKVQTTYWNVENKEWKTDDSDAMFYDIDEKEKNN